MKRKQFFKLEIINAYVSISIICVCGERRRLNAKQSELTSDELKTFIAPCCLQKYKLRIWEIKDGRIALRLEPIK